MEGQAPSGGIESRAPTLVLALGGNAITRAGDDPSVEAQFRRTRETVEEIMPVVASGRWRIAITHGNGPQVGNVLLRSDFAAEAGVLPRLPLDTAVADTQGGMGYMIQQCLADALWESGLHSPVATVITQVLVDEDDPAFGKPTKPIGRFYPRAQVSELEGHGWVLAEDPQGRGWRRVVPSPAPIEIVEQPVVAELLDAGVIVVTCGGGGIPVVADAAGALRGIDAVIDKDLATGLLASGVKAEVLAILSDVDRVYVNYRRPGEKGLGAVDPAGLRRLASEGHFPAGSMGPKIEAAASFVERGGPRAIVTRAGCLEDALAGRAGTIVMPPAEFEAGAKGT